MGKKKRLDKLLLERRIAHSPEEARLLIESSLVTVNGMVRTKSNSQHDEHVSIALVVRKKYVSRGGYKLEAALKAFSLSPQNLTCLDIGCSTGGFTDCLLQYGAAKVYCVDVGYGVLDWKIRKHSNVVVLERTNARFLTDKEVPEPIQLCVIDASFISLTMLLEPVLPFFSDRAAIIALVKPQFQLAREKIGEGGIVTDPELHQEAIDMVSRYGETLGLRAQGVIPAPIQGKKGNQEYLILLQGECRSSQ